MFLTYEHVYMFIVSEFINALIHDIHNTIHMLYDNS